MLWCVVTHSLRNPPVWGHEAEVVSIDATSGAVQRLTRWATTHRYNDIVATGRLVPPHRDLGSYPCALGAHVV